MKEKKKDMEKILEKNEEEVAIEEDDGDDEDEGDDAEDKK